MKNKCENKIEEYCRQAVSYKRYVKARRCDKCCLECLKPCSNICKEVK